MRAPARAAARVVLVAALVSLSALPGLASAQAHERLDAALRTRADDPRGSSRIIVRTADGGPADALIRAVGGTPGRRLGAVGAQVALVPDAVLNQLAALPGIASVSLDREVRGTLERTAAAIGARWVDENLGLDGSGVGVAIIDSGVTAWHDDLPSDRVVHFADFVNAQNSPYDDYGHGTHVAGIIAGNGYHSDGRRRGLAPGASLVVLKALDAIGSGYISNVIAALDYAISKRDVYNIRIINLSVAAGVYESYAKDPLALAARRAVEAGIVVIAAAGNLGRNAAGAPHYGGIAAPGNAPWVLTVGAANHLGTADRGDDVVASFSSRGPAAIDGATKPDLVAPGVGIESIAEPSSLLFAAHPGSRLWGVYDNLSHPYLSLSGTSMAAPVVAATVALMLEANPALTPNAVKAILQYTAEHRARYDTLTQGAGFLNARGAVQLAREFGISPADRPAGAETDTVAWGRQILWGQDRVTGGRLNARSAAWDRRLVWGASATLEGTGLSVQQACDVSRSECLHALWIRNCDTDPGECVDQDRTAPLRRRPAADGGPEPTRR